MAGNTDRRIIQMQFENRQFEKNIAKSTKSVEDLKKAMDFEETAKGLKQFAESTKTLAMTSFDKMAENIQKLTDKFTGLGTVSELIISQIRRGIENAAREISNFANSMTTAQVSAGMDKYNTLNKSVQTIKAATGESEDTVYDVLQRLSDYTDQTSYNFADMAQNIGKFTSVGIGLEAAERQMEGIANWAARSGAGINEASRAMYNLSQAMGVGKLTKIDWKSIENAGMATKEFKEQLIQAGVAAGTLIEKSGKYYTKKGNTEVSFANMAETLQKGWATSQVLGSTLEKYFYDDLYYARDEAIEKFLETDSKIDLKEWTELVSNKDLNMDGFTLSAMDALVALGKLTKETTKDGKKIYKTTKELGEVVEITKDNFSEKIVGKGLLDKEVIDSVTSLSKSSYEAAQKCLTFTDVLGAWKDQISSGWMRSFTIIFGELSDAMEFFSNVCNRVGDAFGNLIDFRNGVLEQWSAKGGRQGLIDLILGDYGKDIKTGAVGILDAIESVTSLIRGGFQEFILAINPGIMMDKAFSKENWENNAEYRMYVLGDMFAQFTRKIQDFFQRVRDYFNEDIEVNGKVTTRLEMIRNIVSGFVGVIALAFNIGEKLFNFLNQVGRDLDPSITAIVDLLSRFGLSIYNTAIEAERSGKLQKFFDDLHTTVMPLIDAFNNLFTTIADVLGKLLGIDKEGATQMETLSKIGDIIKAIADIITKVATPIINFITKIVEALGNLFSKGINGESLKEFGKSFGDAFSGMMNEFADNLPDGFFLKDWIKGLFGGGKEELENQSNTLFGLIGDVTNKADKTTKKAEQNSSTGPGLMGLLTGSNIAVWLGVASLASVLLLLRKARKVVGSVGNFISGLGDTLKNGLKIKYKDESFAAKFLKIGAAIALVAASIYVLGSMPLEGLIQGGIAVGVIVGIMFTLFKLLQSTSKKGGSFKDQLAFAAKVTALAFSMMALGAAVGILALALIPFTLMSWEQYGKAMAGLGGILIEMAAFMGLVKLLKVGTVKLAGFAGFAIGIGLIVKGIAPFANMTWDQYGRAMAGLGGVLLQLLAFMGLMRLMDIGTKGIKLAGIVAFALGIALLVRAILPFASMSWDQYGKVMAGLGGVLLQLLAFMGLMRLLDIGTKGIKLSGIIAFSLAIVLLVQAIIPFKDMTWDQYGRVMAGLGGVLLELIAFMGLMRLLDIGTKGIKLKGIIAFSLALVILVQAILPFKDLTWDQYAKVMAGLGGVLLELLAFMGLMRLMDIGTKGIKLSGIIIFVLAIKFLIEAIMPFTTLSWDQYGKAMAGLGGVMLQLIAFMGLMKLVGTNSLNIAAFLPFAYGIQALVNAILPFANLSWEDYGKTMAGLAGALAIMLGFMAVLKLVKPSVKNMLQMAIFVGLFAAVAGVFGVVLGLVKGMNWKVIGAFSAGLAVLMVAFAAAASIANIAGIKGFVILAAGLAILIAVISLLAPLLAGSLASSLNTMAGSLNYLIAMFESFDSVMKRMDENGPDKGTNMIGKFKTMFESIRGLSGYSGDVRYFSDNLFSLWTGLETFQEHSSQMTDPANDNGLKFIQALADQATNLKTLSTADINNLISNISGLGGAMILYARGAKEVEAEVGGLKPDETPDVTAAVKLMQAISQSLVDEDGFVIPPNMPSTDEFGTFGAQLAALAGALIEFEDAGNGLGAGYQNGKSALEYFKQLKKDLTDIKYEDIYEAIQVFGTEEGTKITPDVLTDFGTRISELGKALNAFAAETTIKDDKTGEMKPVDYSTAISALESFKGLEQDLKRIGNGGYLSNLGGQIQTLGGNLQSFYTAVSQTNFNDENVQSAVGTTEQMIGLLERMNKKFPSVGGLVGTLRTAILGKNFDLTDLGGQIGKLGEGLGTMGENLNKGNWSDNTGTKNALDTLDSIVELMAHLQSFYKQLEIASPGGQNLDPFVAFKNLSDFISYFTTLDANGNVDRDKSALSLIDQISAFMKAVDTSLTDWASDNDEDLDKVINRMEAFKLFMEGISALGSNANVSADWKGIGGKFTTDVAGAITTGMTDVTKAVTDMMTGAYSTATTALSATAWEELGQNIVDGIGNGIANHQEEYFWIPVQEMMKEAYRLGKKSINSNSPSKLFMQLGAYIGEGTAIGIRNSTEEVGDSAYTMGETALESAKNIIAIISQIMEDEDMAPTISPVLDLTNIRSGASTINGLFGDANGLTVNGQRIVLSTDSADEIAMPKDYTDSIGNVNQEIANLRQDIQQLATAMSNMKMVMNTGAVVGAIGPDIDRFLGERGFYASRTDM